MLRLATNYLTHDINLRQYTIYYNGCGNGQHAMCGKGKTHEDAVKILRERNKDFKLIEQRQIDGVMYFHYAP